MLTGEHWQKLLLGHWHRQIRNGSRQLAEECVLFRGVLNSQVLQELNQLDQLILKHAGLSELGRIQSSCRGGRQKSLIILQQENQVYMVCCESEQGRQFVHVAFAQVAVSGPPRLYQSRLHSSLHQICSKTSLGDATMNKMGGFGCSWGWTTILACLQCKHSRLSLW